MSTTENNPLEDLKSQIKLAVEYLDKYSTVIHNTSKTSEEFSKNHIEELKDTFSQQVNQLQQLTSQLNSTKIRLNETDSLNLKNIGIELKKTKKWFVAQLIIMLLASIIIFICSQSALQWYKTSIKTKQEVRKAILDEQYQQNLISIDKDEYNALLGERQIVTTWIKKNPNDSKPLKNFRSGVLKADKTYPAFTSIGSKKVR